MPTKKITLVRKITAREKPDFLVPFADDFTRIVSKFNASGKFGHR